MTCPKCGARLVQGTTVCPICGKKQSAASVNSKKTARGYEPNDLEQDDYEYDEYDSADDYDDYDAEDDYEDYDDYEEAPKRTNRVLVAVIISVLALIAVVAAMIIMMLNSSKNNGPGIPQTVEREQSTTTPPETQAPTTTEAPVKIENNRVTSGNNVYELTNGELKLVQYNDHLQVVRIPKEIGGYPVTAVGRNAFENSTEVEYLQLPQGMKTIDTYAFADIENLKEIVMPESVASIGNYAFNKVAKAICIKDSYAWNFMRYIAEELMEGEKLTIDGYTPPSSSASHWVPPATQPTVPTAPPTMPTLPPQTQPTQPTLPPTDPQPTQPTLPPTDPQPTEPTDPQPTDPTAPQPTDPTDPQLTDPTEPETPPTEPETLPTEPETPPTEPETPPTETVRNAENVLNLMIQQSGGTVVPNSYLYADFNGNGTGEAFALVDVAGQKAIWFNGDDSNSVQLELFPFNDVADASVSMIQNGTVHFVLTVTKATGEKYTSIYATDGMSGYTAAELLPGVIDSDGASLKMDNGSAGVAYLLADGGAYYEFTASEISREQFNCMPGAADVWAQASAVIGADPAGLRFWNRKSAVGNLIQVAFTDVDGIEKYFNAYWTAEGMQLENGTLSIYNGVVRGSYTALPQLPPDEVPQILTEPETPPTEPEPDAMPISLEEGKAVTLTSEGTLYSVDLDGDQASDFIKFSTIIAEDNVNTGLILNVNGTDYLIGNGINAAYKVEVCDLNTADNQLNLVAVGIGADGMISSLNVYQGGSFNNPVMNLGSFSVLAGNGSAEYLADSSHILNPAGMEGKFDAEGGFVLSLVSPRAFPSLGRYICRVPYQLKDGSVRENALNETTGDYEYKLKDLTSTEQFNYILAADTGLYASSAEGAEPALMLAAGTQVFPRKLVLSPAGRYFIYIEDTAGNAGYLPLNDQPLFTAVP